MPRIVMPNRLPNANFWGRVCSMCVIDKVDKLYYTLSNACCDFFLEKKSIFSRDNSDKKTKSSSMFVNLVRTSFGELPWTSHDDLCLRLCSRRGLIIFTLTQPCITSKIFIEITEYFGIWPFWTVTFRIFKHFFKSRTKYDFLGKSLSFNEIIIWY